MTGTFITFEGGEGSGKSTQVKLLCEALAAAKIPHIATREPGGSPGAEHIRKLLVNGDKDAWDAETETLLFYAARIDHVNKLIKPALAEGKTVICDRFADSTLVYQGIGKNLPEEYIHSIHRLTLGNFAPDVTIILDIDPKVGLQRAKTRAGNEIRFESMDFDFHQSVRAGFLAIARREPGRCVVVDVSDDIPKIHADIIKIMNQRFALKL